MSLWQRLARLFSLPTPQPAPEGTLTVRPTSGGSSPSPLKVTFFGPVDGKRCSRSKALELAWRHTTPERRGDLTVIPTEGDRTLFFDVQWPLPGTTVPRRVQLYSVAGPSWFRATPKLTLLRAEAVLFVPTSQPDRGDDNHESLELLDELLGELGHDAPRAFVWLAGQGRTPDELADDLNATRSWPAFTVDRATGAGIEHALDHAVAAAVAGRDWYRRRS